MEPKAPGLTQLWRGRMDSWVMLDRKGLCFAPTVVPIVLQLLSEFSLQFSTLFFWSPGSPTTAGYYGVCRSFPAELDFHSTKQFVSDVYSSPLGSKPFSCDSSAPQGYPALLEPYLSEQFGDHRAPPLPAGTSSFFSPPAVPPLLPSFPNDTGHFLLVSASMVLSPRARSPHLNAGLSQGCSWGKDVADTGAAAAAGPGSGGRFVLFGPI